MTEKIERGDFFETYLGAVGVAAGGTFGAPAVPPISDVEIGHRSTSAPHLANILLRIGRRIQWDGATETIVGGPEASKWLSKEYCAPWKLVAE